MSELNGRTLGSLTVEELDACPEGTEITSANNMPYTKVADGWIDWNGESRVPSSWVKTALYSERTLHLPGEPEPAPAPKSSPVTTIGRFVVLPLANGGRLALPVNGIVCMYTDEDGAVTVGAEGMANLELVLADTFTLDDVLTAIAKVTG